MKPHSHEEHIQHTFDAFCKKVLRNEARDYLDEHTAALDPKTAEIIMQLTGKIVAEKKLTTIMVTHNLRYAVEYGSRLIMMDKGHIVLDVKGEKKKNTKVEDILDLFTSISIECGN